MSRPGTSSRPSRAAKRRHAPPVAPVAPGARRLHQHIGEAERHLAAARHEEAWREVAQVLAQAPTHPAALVVAARIAGARGQHEDALALLDRALAAAPGDTAALAARGDALVRLGRVAEALELLLALVAAHDDDAAAWLALGSALTTAGRRAEAADALRAGIARSSGPATGAYQALVVLDLELGRYESAATGYLDLLRAAGEDPEEHLVTLGPVLGVPDWCARRGAPYRPIAPSRPLALRPPRYAGEAPRTVSVEPWQPPRYVAEIPDATVIGASSVVVTADAEHLLDIASHPAAARFELNKGAVGWLRDGIAMTDTTAAAEGDLDAAIDLVGTFSYNYYHWMLEILPRLASLEAAYEPAELDGIPLLVDQSPMLTPQLVETLAAACPGRRVEILPRHRSRRVRRLILPSQLVWLPPDLGHGLEMEAGDTLVAPEAIAFLRERFLPVRSLPATPMRRIFIMKEGSTRLSNAADLEPVCEALGLERVRPEGLTFAEQVGIFSEADLIVMEGGAGVANVAFAHPGATVLVLVGDHGDHSFFAQVAEHAGATLVHLPGRRVAPHPKLYQCRYVVEPDALRRAVGELTA